MTFPLTARRIATLQPKLRAILTRAGIALGLRRQRAALQRLDDHLLRDIGVTREAAEAEARRSLWDAPDHWKA